MKTACPDVVGPEGLARRTHFRGRLAGWLRQNFYFAMALLIVAIAVYGFSHTFAPKLLDQPYPRPWILYVHATLVPLWLLLFLTQTALVRSRNVKLHRRIGTFGLVLGTIMPIVALVTAVTMDRLHIAHAEQNDFFPPFLIVHINDTTAFLTLFGLAAILRKNRELHSRLMFVATCLLTDAGFARFPAFIFPRFAITLGIAYAGVDALILCGVARDWFVDKSVHAVYRYALPSLVIGQVITTALFATAPSWWLSISHALIGA
jgi:hypothetical protein